MRQEEKETWLAGVVDALERRGLLELAKDVAARHRLTLSEIVCERGHLQAGARRELWRALYEHLPSHELIGNMFNLDQSTIRKGIGRRSRRDGEPRQGQCFALRNLRPFPSDGWSSCAGCSQGDELDTV